MSAPSRADEYHFYQALIGVWPAVAPYTGYAERLKEYMLKSAREAKVRTSWINPDADYEAALARFVSESMGSALFIKELEESIPRLAHLGLLVSLSQALVKVASPGIPDYYQGTELWDFSLVDPDNRRPVDYGVRANYLKEIEQAKPAELLANLADGRAKLHVIRQGLALRKAHPELFHGGEYRALHADAGYEENVIAFALGGSVVAIAPRLFARRLDADALAPLGKFWADARLALPEGEFEDVLTGARHRGGATPMAALLAEFPVALLLRR